MFYATIWLKWKTGFTLSVYSVARTSKCAILLQTWISNQTCNERAMKTIFSALNISPLANLKFVWTSMMSFSRQNRLINSKNQKKEQVHVQVRNIYDQILY